MLQRQKEYGAKIKVYDWVKAGNMMDGATTVVNTTSLGMVGKPEFRIPLDDLSPNAVVTDPKTIATAIKLFIITDLLINIR